MRLSDVPNDKCKWKREEDQVLILQALPREEVWQKKQEGEMSHRHPWWPTVSDALGQVKEDDQNTDRCKAQGPGGHDEPDPISGGAVGTLVWLKNV